MENKLFFTKALLFIGLFTFNLIYGYYLIQIQAIFAFLLLTLVYFFVSFSYGSLFPSLFDEDLEEEIPEEDLNPKLRYLKLSLEVFLASGVYFYYFLLNFFVPEFTWYKFCLLYSDWLIVRVWMFLMVIIALAISFGVFLLGFLIRRFFQKHK
ncbi:MAG: hypothetical protein EU544_04040 [Promethearchaeota archaeon]|nr:MAG: hypothetical protein EU544_04040 [Candidatus Lokiarchaeota archaeon]